MLLIDGVKYELWTPPSEDEFERVVKEHAQEIFGENSMYLDRKQKLKSLAGVGSIPDGLVIMFGNVPEWHIVEVELSSHDPYGHIVPQVDKFLSGVDNRDTRNKIIEALYDAIYGDEFLKLKTQQAIGRDKDIHKFLTDLVSSPPTITIIIEKTTEQLREALKKYTQKKVVEFKTFVRERVSLEVHAHLFKPLYAVSHHLLSPPENTFGEPLPVRVSKSAKVTFGELIDAGLLRDGQILYFYHTKPFNQEQAQVVASSNQLRYEEDGHMYSKSELARKLLIKHGFKRDELSVRGPNYWRTSDGKLLVDLEEQVRMSRGDRG